MSMQQHRCADCGRLVDADAKDCPYCWSQRLIWVDVKAQRQAEQESRAIVPIASTALARPASPRLEALIQGWLEQKEGRTHSARTERAYRETLADFRGFLEALGADLDSPASHLAPAAEKWAAQRARASSLRPRLIISAWQS